MKNCILVLFLIVSTALSAQDEGQQVLKKMNEQYSTAASVSLHFEASYYASTIQSAPTTTMKGDVRYSGTDYYSSAMGKTIVMNKKYMLIVDKNQQTITCLPGNAKGSNDATATGQPDSAWALAKVKVISKTDAEYKLEIAGDDAVYDKTEVTVNATTFELEEVTFYYKKLEDGTSPKLTVKYTDVKLNNSLSASDFSETKYIMKSKGKISTTAAYSSYKIIDLTSGEIPQD